MTHNKSEAKASKQSKYKGKKLDILLGVVAILFLAAGTLRAIQLEADNEFIIVGVGVIAVAYCLNAIYKLVTVNN